jgi:hypothetical protein
MDSIINLNNDNTFSIDDLAIIYYRKIEQDELASNSPTMLDPFNDQHNASFIQALHQLNEDSNQALFAISAKSSELASYLNTLDIKINLLVEKILTPANKQQQAPQKIILNQNGLTFGTDSLFNNNDLLAIKFILQPSYQIFNLLARVINSYPHTEDNLADKTYEYWTHTYFENLSPIHDQWLAKHILLKQVTELNKDKQ